MNTQKTALRFFNSLRQNLLLFLLLFIFGVIVTNHISQVRLDQQKQDLSNLYRQRQAELEQAQIQYAAMVAENERLLAKKESVIADLLNAKGHTELLSELNKVKKLAGLTDVEGPGVRITLDDKPDFDVVYDTADALVHDSDVRYVLDVLRAHGAAALTVNEQRIVNSSYVFCIGPTILCNMQRLTPPYVIEAIGEPDQMYRAILQDPMLSLRQSSEIGLIVKAETKEQIFCPAYKEADDINKYIDRLVVSKNEN